MSTTDQSSSPEIAPGVEQARELDRVVNDPIRLMIMGVLSGAEEVSFKFLQEILQMTPGNLGFQMSKLEDAGYILVHKSFKGKIPVTSYSLTAAGEEAIALQMQHWEAITQGLKRQKEEKRRRKQKNAPQPLPGVS